MAAINFPQNPNINDTYTISNKSWRWDGISWNVVSQTTTLSSGGGSGSGAQFYESTILLSDWVDNGANPSTAEITVNGIKIGDRPYVSLDYSKITSNFEINEKVDAFNKIFRVEVISEGILKFYGPLILITEDLDVLIRVN